MGERTARPVSRRARGRAVLVLACLVVLVLATPASAYTVSFDDRVREAPPSADIVSLSVAQQAGRVRFDVRLREVTPRTQAQVLVTTRSGSDFTFGALPREFGGWALDKTEYRTDETDDRSACSVRLQVNAGEGGRVQVWVPRQCLGARGDTVRLNVIARDIGDAPSFSQGGGAAANGLGDVLDSSGRIALE